MNSRFASLAGLIVAFFAVLSSLPAQADVIFIDLNISNLEVAAARRAAQARGEKLIVIPDVDPPTRARISAKIREAQPVYRTVGRYFGRKDLTPSQQKVFDQAKMDRTKIESELSSILGDKAFTLSKLEDVLKTHKNITSLVISGHADGGFYEGLNSQFEREDLKEVFSKYPQAAQGIRSLLLNGCYTNKKVDALEWLHIFPNAELVAGYDDVAALGTRPESGKYIYGILTKEKALIAASDRAKLNRALRKIPVMRELNAAVAVRNCYVSVKRGFTDLNVAGKDCALLKKRVDEEVGSEFSSTPYRKYSAAQMPGYENPPRNTESGELRELYSFLQNTLHCYHSQSEMPVTPAQVRTLIFFQTVRQNFATYFHDEIARVNQALARAGVEMRFPDVGDPKLSRKDVLLGLWSLSGLDLPKELAAAFEKKKLSPDEGTEIMDLLREGMSVFSENECAPFSWVEPHAAAEALEAPTC